MLHSQQEMNLLELAIAGVAPSQCIGCGGEGSVLCIGCRQAEIIAYGERCGFCGKSSTGGRTCQTCRPGAPRHVWIATNYEGSAKKLINAYKFFGNRAASDDIAAIMADALSDFVADREVSMLNYLIVPIPSATRRLRERSFDHSRLLAQKLARRLNIDSINALGRLGQSRQVGAKREIRQKQAEGSYYVRLPYLIKGRNILLVDDVLTTGATIKAATKVLRQAGAGRVDALIFAKKL